MSAVGEVTGPPGLHRVLTAVRSLSEEEALSRLLASIYFASKVAIGRGESLVATFDCFREELSHGNGARWFVINPSGRNARPEVHDAGLAGRSPYRRAKERGVRPLSDEHVNASNDRREPVFAVLWDGLGANLRSPSDAGDALSEGDGDFRLGCGLQRLANIAGKSACGRRRSGSRQPYEGATGCRVPVEQPVTTSAPMTISPSHDARARRHQAQVYIHRGTITRRGAWSRRPDFPRPRLSPCNPSRADEGLGLLTPCQPAFEHGGNAGR